MSEPDIQCQPDTPDCLVNSAWIEWATARIEELERMGKALVTLDADIAATCDVALEIQLEAENARLERAWLALQKRARVDKVFEMEDRIEALEKAICTHMREGIDLGVYDGLWDGDAKDADARAIDAFLNGAAELEPDLTVANKIWNARSS